MKPAAKDTMINRAALLVRYRQPFVDWINAADPARDRTVTLADANDENTIYLVEVEDSHELEQWLKPNHEIVFANELNGWYTDPSLRPRDRSLEQLRLWCHLELHTVVHDTGTTVITAEI